MPFCFDIFAILCWKAKKYSSKFTFEPSNGNNSASLLISTISILTKSLIYIILLIMMRPYSMGIVIVTGKGHDIYNTYHNI